MQCMMSFPHRSLKRKNDMNMYNTLLDLETRFLKLSYISDAAWLDEVLHDDFHEMGKSGVLYNKSETIYDLMKCKADRDIGINNFECIKIVDNSWLVHYVTQSGDKRYYRTSVWVNDGNMKLLFHQASELK